LSFTSRRNASPKGEYWDFHGNLYLPQGCRAVFIVLIGHNNTLARLETLIPELLKRDKTK
jgi:hypothetical protein